MRLNNLKSPAGAKTKKKRVGRGIGSGLGKTCGLGHKGQKARAGGFHRLGFEGGQVPLYRRLPKFGFKSRMASYTTEVPLHQLNRVIDGIVDLSILKKLNIVQKHIKRAKIILSGELKKAVTIRGLRVTKGAKAAIEAAKGNVEE